MNWTTERILAILDQCCDDCTFPMLDNGYVYPAAARMSLHRSPEDWALVIETFGFSPRVGEPTVTIQTYASRLHDRAQAARYVTTDAHAQYLAAHPHDEYRSAGPLDGVGWQDPEENEFVLDSAREASLRGENIRIPSPGEYASLGIDLTDPPRVRVFEFCRAVAHLHRDRVLATPSERRVNVLPNMRELFVLEAWHHPDVVDDSKRPSGSETFQQLAQVLVSGDTKAYSPSLSPNTHWKNWPEGGTL